jgi:hypothetical protein
MAQGKIMNKDVKKNNKNRRNALGSIYAVIKMEKQDYSKIQHIRQYIQKHYQNKKTVATQTYAACEQRYLPVSIKT